MIKLFHIIVFNSIKFHIKTSSQKKKIIPNINIIIYSLNLYTFYFYIKSLIIVWTTILYVTINKWKYIIYKAYGIAEAKDQLKNNNNNNNKYYTSLQNYDNNIISKDYIVKLF